MTEHRPRSLPTVTTNRAFWEQRPRERSARVVPGGQVRVIPSPDGMMRIVGTGANGEWIAEFACLDLDFTEAMVTRMAGHVARSRGVRRLGIVG